jgi:hypothetical protein
MTSHRAWSRSHAQPPVPAIQVSADRADTDDVSTVRKLLLAVLLVSLAGSAFGAGTFASFSASVTNAASTFSTGSIVLTNNVNSGTDCYSTASGVTGATGANTDTNNNATCGSIVTAATDKPGSTYSRTVAITNKGSIATAANGLKLYGSGACTDGNSANSNSYFGTGSMCETLQMTVEGAGKCAFGLGMGIAVKSSAAVLASPTATLVVAAGNASTITINSQLVTVTPGTYGFSTTSGNGTLAAALQTALAAVPAANAMAGVGMDGRVYIASTIAGATGTATIAAGTSGNTTLMTQLNLGSPVSVHGATQDAACDTTANLIADSDGAAYTVASFAKAYTTSANALTAQAAALAANNGSTTYTVALALETAAGNQYQGRSAQWGMTWTAIQ